MHLRRTGTLAALVLASAAVLAALEGIGLAALGFDLGPRLWAILCAQLATGVLGVELLLRCVDLGARRAGPRLRPWAYALLALPFALWASSALLSGDFISRVRGVGVLRAVSSLGLAAAAPLAVWLWDRLLAGPGNAMRLLTAAAALVLAFGLSWLDTHFQVGLYPAFHFLVAAALLWTSALACRLALPRAFQAPLWLGLPALAALAACAALSATTWNSIHAMSLANYSHGLLSKQREVVALLTAPGDDGEAPVAAEVDPDPFRFQPLQSEEIDDLRAAARNLVFILVDGFRDDHLGQVFEGRSLTPFWDRWSRQAVRFQNTYSPSDSTSKSMPSIMSSYPLAVVNLLSEQAVPVVTWMDVLRERGFRTFANGNCDRVNVTYGHVRMNYCYGAEETLPNDGIGEDVVDQILAFAVREPDRPFAVFSHWMDPHTGKMWKDAPQRYRAAVRRVDARLASLVARLQEAGLYGETVIALTGDHGYFLGEDNMYLGSHGGLERQVRVPLLLRLPGDAFGGRTVSETTSGLAVAPTVYDILAPDEDRLVGDRSLLGLLADPADPRRSNTHTVVTSNGSMFTLRRGAQKLIWQRKKDVALVFDLASDPHEKQPLDDPELARSLLAELQRVRARERSLGVALVGRHRDDVPYATVAAFAASRPEPADLLHLFDGFWQRDAAERDYVLRMVLTRGVRGLGVVLDRIARDSWDDGDQLLYVTRLFQGSERACDELPERLAQLSGPGRRAFAEVLGDLPRFCVEPVVERLGDEILRLHATRPARESEAEHFLVLAVTGLAEVLEQDTPRALKRVMVEQFNHFARMDSRFLFATLRIPRLFNHRFLDMLERSVRDEELALLDGLDPTAGSVKFLVNLCLEHPSAAREAYLLAHIEGMDDAYLVGLMLPRIEKLATPSFVDRTNAVIRSRFPQLTALVGGNE